MNDSLEVKRNEHEGQCHQLFYSYSQIIRTIRHSTVAVQMFKILFFDKDGFFEETRKQQGENVEQGTQESIHTLLQCSKSKNYES